MAKLQKLRLVVQIFFLVLIFFGINPLFGDNINIFLLVTALLLGSFFCGWLCVFGTYQELLGKLGRKLFTKRLQLPAWLDKGFSLFRYIAIFLAIALLTDTLNARRAFVAIINNKQLLSATLLAFATFSLLSLLVDRPFCRWLCSKGATYGLLSLGRVVTIKKDDNLCLNCQKCSRECPMGIQVAQTSELVDPRCINCLQCLSACPAKGSLFLSVRSMLTMPSLTALCCALCFFYYVQQIF